MAKRGTYAKGVARREEILNTALTVIARNGYSKATLKQIAEAVGLSQMGLLHYFDTKEELFTQVLRRRDQLDTANFSLGKGGLISRGESLTLHALVKHNSMVPGLVQLYSRLSIEASEPSHPAHEYFRERIANLRVSFAKEIAAAQESGEVPADLDPENVAITLISLLDGLQIAWLYDSSINMAEHVDLLMDRLLRR
jgi:AcrR family transcriptional regulator